MILKYNITADPQKLSRQMSEVAENFRILYYDDFITIDFFDISAFESHTYSEDGLSILETDTTYKKRTKVKNIAEDGSEVIGYEYVDYAFDRDIIDTIIAYHDSIDFIRDQHILKLSNDCNKICLRGIDFTWGGATNHFSLSELDQSKIQMLHSMVLNGQEFTTWHPDGGECEVWSAEKFKAFAQRAIRFITENTVRFNTGLRPYLKTLETKEEIESVGFYDALPDEYELKIAEMISYTLTGSGIS